MEEIVRIKHFRSFKTIIKLLFLWAKFRGYHCESNILSLNGGSLTTTVPYNRMHEVRYFWLEKTKHQALELIIIKVNKKLATHGVLTFCE